MSPSTSCNKSVCFIQLLESVSIRCCREVSPLSGAGAICVCLAFLLPCGADLCGLVGMLKKVHSEGGSCFVFSGKFVIFVRFGY